MNKLTYQKLNMFFRGRVYSQNEVENSWTNSKNVFIRSKDNLKSEGFNKDHSDYKFQNDSDKLRMQIKFF